MNATALAVVLLAAIVASGALAHHSSYAQSAEEEAVGEPAPVGAEEGAAPAEAVDDPALKVVINEIELNPFGKDGYDAFEWVEIYNPSDSFVNIDGWVIDVSSTNTTINVPDDILLRPGQYFTITRAGEWLRNITESATLRDGQGRIIDQTPLLIDVDDNLDTWQRTYDALDTGSQRDWTFRINTQGYSNGITPDVEKTQISINVETDRFEYSVGDTVLITGRIDGVDLTKTSFFLPPHVTLAISGESYEQEIIVTPGDDLTYATSVMLQSSSGPGLGVYDVVASYVGRTAATSFAVNAYREPTLSTESNPGFFELSIRTDSLSYLPGDTVTFLGNTDVLFAGAGLEFQVHDPDGMRIFEGVLFPSDRTHSTALRTIDEDLSDGAQFGTTFFVDLISPKYGTYSITAQYGDLSASAAFDVEYNEIRDAAIRLLSDKSAYAPGDTVSITGSTNMPQIGSFSIKVEHLQNNAVVRGGSSGFTKFLITETVEIMPNGKFSYDFAIPDDLTRVGRYEVNVSGESVDHSISFNVRTDPMLYGTDKFTVGTDKDEYVIGERITFSGAVAAQGPTPQSSTVIVRIVPQNDPVSAGYILAAVPGTDGEYEIDNIVERTLFEQGGYDVTASYIRADLSTLLDGAERAGTYNIKRIANTPAYTATASFTVADPRDLDGRHFSAALGSPTYKLGETVTVSGVTAVDVDIPLLRIAVLQPDGTTVSDTADIGDDGTYSWSWTLPSVRTSLNEGSYELTVESVNHSEKLVFTVGGDATVPAEDLPLTMYISSKTYGHGDVVEISGKAALPDRDVAYHAPSVPVIITVSPTSDPNFKTTKIFVTPDRGGIYATSERISPGIYSEGSYIISASYERHKAHEIFHVGAIPSGIRADTSSSQPSPVEAATEDESSESPVRFDLLLRAPSRIVDTDTTTGNTVKIDVSEQTESGVTYAPRSITARAHIVDSSSSLKLTHNGDTCVVGSDSDCIIRGLTRTSGSVYRTVSVDGNSFDVRYSGSDGSVLRLTVIPSSEGGAIPDSVWDVEASNTRSGTLTYRVVYTPVLG